MLVLGLENRKTTLPGSREKYAGTLAGAPKEAPSAELFFTLRKWSLFRGIGCLRHRGRFLTEKPGSRTQYHRSMKRARPASRFRPPGMRREAYTILPASLN